jgi:hypothetical protein
MSVTLTICGLGTYHCPCVSQFRPVIPIHVHLWCAKESKLSSSYLLASHSAFKPRFRLLTLLLIVDEHHWRALVMLP